jgi:hypothetical protein
LRPRRSSHGAPSAGWWASSAAVHCVAAASETSTTAAATRGGQFVGEARASIWAFSGEKNIAPKKCPENKSALKE